MSIKPMPKKIHGTEVAVFEDLDSGFLLLCEVLDYGEPGRQFAQIREGSTQIEIGDMKILNKFAQEMFQKAERKIDEKAKRKRWAF